MGQSVALAVNRLTVTAFRNYETARLETDGRPVILVGPNGAGKTNLLEAVSLLTPGRGMRLSRVPDIDRKPGDQSWAVAADVRSVSGLQSIGTGRDPKGEKRLIRIDGAPAKSQAQLSSLMSVVWLTPQMDRLFLDSAGERRRFLDRLIYGFDPAHAGRLTAYEKAMRQRSKLLKDGVQDDIWLRSLEAQMVERGIAIAAARKEMADRLNRACEKPVGPFPGARIVVTGAVEEWLGQYPALEVEGRLQRSLKDARAKDAITGGASVGTHRSDLDVFHLEKEMAASICSTGEQKALLIAMILGDLRLQAAERGRVPVLLLDEVAAHLDAEKRLALFETLHALKAQYWLTGTDQEMFLQLKDHANFYHVEDAIVSRV